MDDGPHKRRVMAARSGTRGASGEADGQLSVRALQKNAQRFGTEGRRAAAIVPVTRV